MFVVYFSLKFAYNFPNRKMKTLVLLKIRVSNNILLAKNGNVLNF